MSEHADFKHGMGIVSWSPSERRSLRYGAFRLQAMTCDDIVMVEPHLDIPMDLIGQRVKVSLRVITPRQSAHPGDHFLGVMPVTPEVNDIIVLGPGILSLEKENGVEALNIILAPEDGRSKLWIDPQQLYILHDQTVEMHLEATSEPCITPAPIHVEPGAISLGDGTIQLCETNLEDVFVSPIIEPIEDMEGTFTVRTGIPPLGQRLRTS